MVPPFLLLAHMRLQVPADAGLGRWVWYGYVHGGLNWIGRFRSTGVQVGLVAYAGSFMMARSEA